MDKLALLSIIILTIALPIFTPEAHRLEEIGARLRTRFIIVATFYAAYIIYLRPRIATL